MQIINFFLKAIFTLSGRRRVWEDMEGISRSSERQFDLCYNMRNYFVDRKYIFFYLNM